MMARKPRIFTLGHEGLDLDRFFTVLESSSIQLVADVRLHPDSAEYGCFRRSMLSDALADYGIAYRRFRELSGPFSSTSRDHLHSALADGGWRSYASAMNSENFIKGVEELFGLAASTTTAVLGFAIDYRHCLRRLLADRLLFSGLRVVHIFNTDAAVEHEYHTALEIRASELFYVDRQLKLLR